MLTCPCGSTMLSSRSAGLPLTLTPTASQLQPLSPNSNPAPVADAYLRAALQHVRIGAHGARVAEGLRRQLHLRHVLVASLAPRPKHEAACAAVSAWFSTPSLEAFAQTSISDHWPDLRYVCALLMARSRRYRTLPRGEHGLQQDDTERLSTGLQRPEGHTCDERNKDDSHHDASNDAGPAQSMAYQRACMLVTSAAGVVDLQVSGDRMQHPAEHWQALCSTCPLLLMLCE